jgi:small subunit ribosomal protein S20
MPNLANARKALRQSKVRAERNKVTLSELHSLRVKFRKLVADKKKAEAADVAKVLAKKFDKAVGKGVVKMNTAARTKSRLMKTLNAVK